MLYILQTKGYTMAKYNVVIRTGPHHTDAIVDEYEFFGNIDQAEADAKSACRENQLTCGRRVRVEFTAGLAIATSRIFQEGFVR